MYGEKFRVDSIHLRFTFATFILAARLPWMISKDFVHQLVGTLLECVDDSVVQWILVLLKPVRNVVWHLEETFPYLCVILGAMNQCYRLYSRFQHSARKRSEPQIGQALVVWV